MRHRKKINNFVFQLAFVKKMRNTKPQKYKPN